MYSRRAMGGPDDGSSRRTRGYESDPYYSAGYGYGGSGGYIGQFRTLPVVRLRGLPYNCTEGDVHEFFAGLNIVDVLMVHKQGRFSGDAYLVLSMAMQVDLALRHNRQHMGWRYIEVFRSNKKEYYHAVATELQDAKTHDKSQEPREKPAFSKPVPLERQVEEHTGVLRLRGLPFLVSKQDIMEFFSQFELTEDNIYILTLPEGRTTGEAFVEFSDPEESKAAMKKDKMTIVNRYIELFVSSHAEATQAAAANCK